MSNLPKFNKEKCKKCIYRGYFSNTSNGKKNLYCAYHKCDMNETCLKRAAKGEIIDIRGEGPECKLYSEGSPIVLSKRTTSVALTKTEQSEGYKYVCTKMKERSR